MRESCGSKRRFAQLLLGVGLCTIAATGCQVDVGGQTLPSPWYQADDIQYFPAGAEFKLSREAAAQQAFKEEQGQVAEPVNAQPVPNQQ